MAEEIKVVIFDDQFEDPVLGSDWVISSGRGSYSLIDKPGYLRYVIDANHTARVAGSGQNYAKSLWLVRPFSGDRWILKTAITYNMRPAAPTNNRNMHFVIRAPGDNGAALVRIDRSVGVNDSNPSSNAMCLSAGSNSETIFFANSPNSLPGERWYFEIERNKDYAAIRASRGGDDSTFEYVREYTFPSGSFGNEQEIEINGDGWYGSNNPPGYADFDFIKVEGGPSTIQVKVNIDPDTVNLKSMGKWITAYIEAPKKYDVRRIDISSVLLNERVKAETEPIEIRNNQLMVKFNQTDVKKLLSTGEKVKIMVSGSFIDGPKFEGNDTIKVISPGLKK